MGFVVVAEARDVPPGHIKLARVGDRELLVANLQGKFYAVDNRCPHKQADMSQGKLEGNLLVCPEHGAKFDVTSGKAVAPGKKGLFKINVADLRSYEARVEGTQVLVRVG